MEGKRSKRNKKSVERFSHEEEQTKNIWTQDEKIAFYKALVKHGYGDMEKLYEAVPTKTKTRVMNFCDWAKKNGMFKYEPGKEPPLETWLSLLEYKLSDTIDLSKTPQHLLPMMMRMIAETEQHPPPEKCGGIDFRTLYLALGQCFQGTGLNGLHLNEATAKFLQKQMVCLDNMSQVQDLSAEKDLLANHKLSSSQVDAAYRRNAAAQCDQPVPLQQNELWNPLKVPEEMLKFNYEDMARHYPKHMGPDLPFPDTEAPAKVSRETLKTIDSIQQMMARSSIDLPSASAAQIQSNLVTIPISQDFEKLDSPCAIAVDSLNPHSKSPHSDPNVAQVYSNLVTIAHDFEKLNSPCAIAVDPLNPDSKSPDSGPNEIVEPICHIEELEHNVNIQ